MEDHIKKICKTCHFHLTNVSKIRTYLDCESTETIIQHAFVTTNLDYCNAILYGLPKVLLNCLQLVQNTAARIVTFTRRYEHVISSLADLHWLPVEYRIICKILLLVYKAINGFSPSYISNLLLSYSDQRFSIIGPKLWYSIPSSLRNANSLNCFQKNLKRHIYFTKLFLNL